jgi:hypothetical protein
LPRLFNLLRVFCNVTKKEHAMSDAAAPHTTKLEAATGLHIDGAPLLNDRWVALVEQLGMEIAEPLTAALERINLLTSTGHIDRQSLRALREEVETARRVGMIGQQLTRFSSGRIRQAPERLQLADVLGGVLAHRSRETHARGILLKPELRPADVTVDAELLFSMLNTLLDWALACAHSQIVISVDANPWTPDTRLICHFANRPLDQLTPGLNTDVPRDQNSLTWRLLEQCAWAMQLTVNRSDEAGMTTLAIDFPQAADEGAEAVSVIELNDGFALSTHTQGLAGSHVLVVASRRDMRLQILDSLRDMSLIVDFVSSVEEAAAFCRDGLPHAIVVESIQNDDSLTQLREEILAEVPDFVFIEILEEGAAFEMSGFDGTAMARVGREVLSTSLPSALLFELSRSA